ncbi:adenosylmethionine--8-amino-7-oxononanoate transaminase [Holtiella tumoricola]
MARGEEVMDYIEKDLEYIWHPCSQMKDYESFKPIVIEKGKGLRLYDTDGNVYLDAVSSWWCNLFGHSNPKINAALCKQVESLEHVIFANFTHKPVIELCDRLHKVLPKGLDKFFFTDNGSAAVEAALKMSFHYHAQIGQSNKKRFMALTDAYHGETIGALSVGDLDIYTEVYKPLMIDVTRVQGPDCYRCPYGKCRENCQAECFEKVEKELKIYGQEVSAFIIEPLVQAAAGMKIYPAIYLKKLREACDQYDIHLIADEIAVGFGRTGKMFACEHAGISPDMICLSKGLTGGYMPMALVATTNKVYDAFYADYLEGKSFMHSHTYSGNPLGASCALAVLNIFEDEKILEGLPSRNALFHKKVEDALGDLPYVGEIRHIGFINGIELVRDKRTKEPFSSELRIGYEIYKIAVSKGLLLRPLGNVLYFNPPLSMTEEEMDEMIAICKASIETYFNGVINKSKF